MRPRQTIAVTTAILAVVAAFGVLYWAATALFTVLLAFVIATAALPAVEGSTARWPRLPRSIAAFVFLLLIGAVGIGGAVLALPVLTDQADALLEALPALCRDARQWTQIGHGWPQRLTAHLLPPSCAAPRLLDSALLSQLLHPGPESFAAVQTIGITAVIVAALAFAWLRERRAAMAGLESLFALTARPVVLEFVQQAESRIGGFLRGQLVLSAVVAVTTFAVYTLLGLPNAYALAALAGFAEVIPVIGPIAAAVTGLAVALTTDPGVIWGVVALAVGLRLAVDYVVGPIVMGKSAGVNPFLVILSLVALTEVGGIIGAMVAIPLAVILQLAGERWLFSEPAAAPDRSSSLRYEARALMLSLRKASLGRRSTPDLDDEIELCAGALTRHLEQRDAETPS